MYPVQFDQTIRSFVHAMQTEDLTDLAFALSFLGSVLVLTGITVFVGLGCLAMGQKRPARTLAIVMVGEVIFQNGLKQIFARVRPEAFFGATVDTYSFPSGHALSSTCLFGALALLALPHLRHAGWRVAIVALAVTGAGAIGWSRIYLGVHYPSDVIGGFVIGIAWLGLLVGLGQFRPVAAPTPARRERAVIVHEGPPRPMLVVMSRNPGSLRDRPAMQATLRPMLAAAGIEPEFADLESPTLDARIADAIAAGMTAIVAAGGDGTISFVGQKLARTETPLGVIPLGTMNLFAKDLGIPVGDMAAAVETLGAGHVRRVDVGDVNGRVFLCGSVLGLPARLAQYRKRGNTWWESLRLWARYGRAFLRALLRFRPFRATLSLGDQTLRLNVSSLMITPNAVNVGTGPILGRSELTGDHLAVYVIDRLRVGTMLRLMLRALTRSWQQDQAVSDYIVRRLAIVSRSPGIRVMNDGEIVILAPPLRYRILPRALAVICPPLSPKARA